jgi:hypothetical protein
MRPLQFNGQRMRRCNIVAGKGPIGNVFGNSFVDLLGHADLPRWLSLQPLSNPLIRPSLLIKLKSSSNQAQLSRRHSRIPQTTWLGRSFHERTLNPRHTNFDAKRHVGALITRVIC